MTPKGFPIPISISGDDTVKIYVARLMGPHATYRFERSFLRGPKPYQAAIPGVTPPAGGKVASGFWHIDVPREYGYYEVQDYSDSTRSHKRHRYYQVYDEAGGYAIQDISHISTDYVLDAIARKQTTRLDVNIHPTQVGRWPAVEQMDDALAALGVSIEQKEEEVVIQFREAVRMLKEMQSALASGDYDAEDLMMYVDTALAALAADASKEDKEWMLSV